jgi:dihydrofolate synthase/folylpolyglutamate synthase
VLGALGPKEPEEVLEELAALMPDLVVTCTAPSPRAVPADRLAALMGAQGLDVEPVADAVEAVRRAVALADDDDLVLVTGSFYVLSAARQALAEAP